MTSKTNCTRCKKGKSIIELVYNKESLCKKCFNNLFEKRVRRTIRRGKLLKTTDKVAVGVSGGKDSIVVLHMLSKLMGSMPKSELVAIIIDEGVAGYREDAIKMAEKACDKLEVTHHIFSIKDEYGFSLDEIVKKDDSVPACSYCGVLRRRILNDKARMLKCDKLATGHNLDDEIQATLMNVIRGDLKRIARMGANVGVIDNKKFVPRIKPLRESPEKEIGLYAIANRLGAKFSECPYSFDAFRKTIRDMLNTLEEKHPGSKFQLLRTTDKLIPMTRECYKVQKPLSMCSKCGEPTSDKICKTCQMIDKLKSL